MKKALTSVALAALKPNAKPYYVSDAKQDGLRVRVAPSGAMTWSVVWRIKGAGIKSASLGKCDPSGREGLDLAGARDRAASIMRAAREGRDLLAEEKAEQEAAADAMTIADLIDRYAKHISSPHRKGGPLRTATEIERRLRRALDTKLTKPADGLKRRDISRLLDDVAETHPREAEKRRQVIHAMYGWAMQKGFVEANPTSGLPGYSAGEMRDRALTQEEIRKLWGWLDAGAAAMPPDVIDALRLQLCLGARVGEIAGMDAGELEHDGERLIWTLPASRSKNKQPRVTPLVGRARDIVEGALAERPRGPLFRTTDWSRALTATDIGAALVKRKEKLPIAHFTTHDLRRTVVSQMDEMGIRLDDIAAVVGHQRGTRATQTLIRHYSRPRLDERVQAALEAWNARLTEIINGTEQPDNIIRLSA